MTDAAASADRILEVDEDMIRTLELEGQLCFHCPLLEQYPASADAITGECRVRAGDVLPFVLNRDAGVRIAARGNRIVGYAVFGRPELYHNLASLPFDVDDDALLVGALYATPEARETNTDIDLLISVMDFAREHGYEKVQVACRKGEATGTEARSEILEASGFGLTEDVDGLCLAETTLEQWDSSGEETDD